MHKKASESDFQKVFKNKTTQLPTPPPAAPPTPAETLIADLAASRVGAEENTLDAVWPSKIYRRDVTVIAPDGRATMVNPKYCLTDFATQELIAALAERGLNCSVMEGGGPPNNVLDALQFGWHYSDVVNWLAIIFPRGALNINAGIVYDYFAHGLVQGAKYALNNAEWECRTGAFTAGVGEAFDAAAIFAQTTA